jgi:hypothetical protein
MYKFSTIFVLFLLFVFPTLPVYAVDENQQSESPKDHYLIHMEEIIVSTPMQDRLSSSAMPVNILHDEELRLKASGTIG